MMINDDQCSFAGYDTHHEERKACCFHLLNLLRTLCCRDSESCG